MTRIISTTTPSSPTLTSREQEGYQIDIIQRSKKFIQSRTDDDVLSNQRSKFNKNKIWMKKIFSHHSFLYRHWCSLALVLVLFFATLSVEAVFTPADRDALKTAVDLCVAETDDGSCPIYAGSNSNGVIGDWDVSKVNDMSYIFNNTESFNADISKWVRHRRCSSFVFIFKFVFVLFRLTNFSFFLRTLTTQVTSQVTNMKAMFRDCFVFDQDISGWDTSEVTNMELMFLNSPGSASARSIDLSEWVSIIIPPLRRPFVLFFFQLIF